MHIAIELIILASVIRLSLVCTCESAIILSLAVYFTFNIDLLYYICLLLIPTEPSLGRID